LSIKRYALGKSFNLIVHLIDNIKLKDNQKARILDTELSNKYVPSVGMKKVKSQVETYNYLIGKK
jgi:polyphosphate kinase